MQHPTPDLIKAWLSLINYELPSTVKSPREIAVQAYLSSMKDFDKPVEPPNALHTDKKIHY